MHHRCLQPGRIAWRANDCAIITNGGTPALDTNGALPWLMVDAAPHSATGGTNCCEAFSRVAFYPRRLVDSVLQTLTAP